MSICLKSRGELTCVLEAGHDPFTHMTISGQAFRIPLVRRELNEEEAKRLNPDLTPKDSTDAERAAAEDPGLPAPEKAMPELAAVPEPITDKNPAPSFVPPTLKKIAAGIASLGGLALLTLPILPLAIPAWVGTVVFAVTAISGFLAGVAMPGFSPSKPVLPLAVVPSALALAAFLTDFAMRMHPGLGQNAVLLLAAVLGALAGKAIPQPKA
jgi:hypothetical protein